MVIDFNSDERFVETDEYRYKVLRSSRFIEARSIIIDTLTNKLYSAVIHNESAEDLWWVAIQAVLEKYNATYIPREMFVAPAVEELPDDIHIINLDDTVICTSRTEMFEACADSMAKFGVEALFQSFADTYMSANEYLFTLFMRHCSLTAVFQAMRSLSERILPVVQVMHSSV